MNKKTFLALIVCFGALTYFICLPALFADNEKEPVKNRPAPVFDHTLHEEALDDPGCGACHHVLDEQTQKLVYSEGEESACSECHFEKAEDGLLALREANHASCTACHRKMIKSKLKSGPTTCGECHPKN